MHPYEELCQWERTEAVEMLRKCGLKEGMTVLDIGCGHSHYTIPAAIAIGTSGMAIGLEKVKKIAKAATGRLAEARITNAEIVLADHNGFSHGLDGSFDFVMLYDVIHHSPREEFLAFAKRQLKSGGILSLLAFKDLSGYKSSVFPGALKELIEQIQLSGFQLSHTVENGGVHFDNFHSSYHWKRYGEVRVSKLERGTVYNFVNDL